MFEFTSEPIVGEKVPQNLALFANTDVIFSGWGGPVMDETFLRAAPKLEAVFYAAGTIRGIVTDAFWKRSITICSAWAANAIPVSEFTFAQIILALKNVLPVSRAMHQQRQDPLANKNKMVGAYDAKVGVIGLGMIGRMVVKWLHMLHVEVWVYDPGLSPERAEEMGVRMADLDTIFSECDVISLHAPDLESTRGMITGAHINRIRPGGTFINTARGIVVREEEMIEVLKARPDISAVLDVTWPDPPVAGSVLYELPNVYLTPHIAGSVGNECWRMGDYMLGEAVRYLKGGPLQWQVTQEIFRTMA
jgi:phosphoglycerate dehydrogenase-like enzyme